MKWSEMEASGKPIVIVVRQDNPVSGWANEIMQDNEKGECSVCGAGVIVRPHSRKLDDVVYLVCTDCLNSRPDGMPKINQFGVTKETMQEIRELAALMALMKDDGSAE